MQAMYACPRVSQIVEVLSHFSSLTEDHNVGHLSRAEFSRIREGSERLRALTLGIAQYREMTVDGDRPADRDRLDEARSDADAGTLDVVSAIDPDGLYRTDHPTLRSLGTAGTLAQWRHRGTGPPFVRYGRLILYRGRDLLRWLDEHMVYPEGSEPPSTPEGG